MKNHRAIIREATYLFTARAFSSSEPRLAHYRAQYWRDGSWVRSELHPAALRRQAMQLLGLLDLVHS